MLRRQGAEIALSGVPGEPSGAVTLAPTSTDSVEARHVRESFQSLAARYPRYQDHIEERTAVSIALIAVAVALEVTLFVMWRLRSPLEIPLRALFLVAWVTGGIWITRVYLQT